MQHLLTHITDDRLPELRVALNRALNTWDDGPAWLFALCDALDAGSVYCQNPMMEDNDTVAIVTPEFMAKLKPMLHMAEPKMMVVAPRQTGLNTIKERLATLDTFEEASGIADLTNSLRRNKEKVFELYPYQQKIIDNLSFGVGLDTISTKMGESEDIVDPSFDYLPEWASRKVTPGEDGYLCLHAQLMTRDGRRNGNAVIASFEKHPVLGQLARIVTDMGNEVRMTRRELEDGFYPPVYVMKPDAVGVRIGKQSETPEAPDTFRRYRVWPDGTVQEATETAHAWMSDDYFYVIAVNEDVARSFANRG